MKNKIVAMLLASAMLVGTLVGCGAEENKTNETVQETTESTGTKETSTKETSSDTVIEDEEPVELTIMANFGELGYLGEQWIKELEEAVNVKINWQLPAVSSYEESIQLMLLDDEKPDAVILPDSWLTGKTYIKACEEGMFLNIADVLPNYENIMAHTADISWDALDVLQNGGIYGVPRSTMVRCDGFAFKTEWLEAIGSDYKGGEYLTTDEFFDILYKFTYEDPDGNGVDDTYGLQVYADENGKLISGLEYIFGIGDTDAWGLYDGEYKALKYSQTDSNFKEYLAFANKCWEAGVIDPDSFSIDGTVSGERNKAGMYGAVRAFAGYLRTKPSDDEPWTQTYCPGVVVNEGDSYGFPNYSTGIWYFWGIPSDCERPDKVLELFDYILSDEQWTNLAAQGVEGVSFDIDEAGNYDFTKYYELSDTEKNNTPLSVMLRRSDGPEYFISKTLDAETRAKLKGYVDMAVENYVPAYDRGYAPEIVSDSVFIEYNNYMRDQINKIIIGEEPVEYWDEVLQGWYDAGGAEYVADMQAYIASFE